FPSVSKLLLGRIRRPVSLCALAASSCWHSHASRRSTGPTRLRQNTFRLNPGIYHSFEMQGRFSLASTRRKRRVTTLPLPTLLCQRAEPRVFAADSVCSIL